MRTQIKLEISVRFNGKSNANSFNELIDMYKRNTDKWEKKYNENENSFSFRVTTYEEYAAISKIAASMGGMFSYEVSFAPLYEASQNEIKQRKERAERMKVVSNSKGGKKKQNKKESVNDAELTPAA